MTDTKINTWNVWAFKGHCSRAGLTRQDIVLRLEPYGFHLSLETVKGWRRPNSVGPAHGAMVLALAAILAPTPGDTRSIFADLAGASK